MKTKLIILAILLPLCSLSFAQGTKVDYPIIGQSCPDFTLYDVDHYEKETVSLNDFKGKWLILDFWSKTCTACIQSFPKINKLQQEFGDQIQFLLIGDNNTKYNTGIKELYKRIAAKQNLQLIAAYDSVLMKQFGITTVPHVIIIDPKGITRAVTYSDQINSENLKKLLSGKNQHFIKKTNKFEPAENPSVKPQSVAIDSNLISYSSFSVWDGSSIKWPKEIEAPEKGQFEAYPMSLDQFYNLAYWGKTNWNLEDPYYANYWRVPIKEVKDPILFNARSRPQKGLYSYRLQVSKEQSHLDGIQKAMQSDLKKNIGYAVQIETREMPCWSLIKLNNFKEQEIKKDSTFSISGDHSGFQLKNVSINRLLRLIWNYHQLAPPFIDQTGIKTPITIELHAIMTDLDEINRALQANGLKLIKSTKIMNVLVIKDQKKK